MTKSIRLVNKACFSSSHQFWTRSHEGGVSCWCQWSWRRRMLLTIITIIYCFHGVSSWMSAEPSDSVTFSSRCVTVGLTVGWQRTITSVGETQVHQWDKLLASVSVLETSALRKMWHTVFLFFTFKQYWHESFLLSQAPSSTYPGRSPSTRPNKRVNVSLGSWRWSAIFTPPGISRTTTSVTAAGWETAAYASPSVTPGGAVEASPRPGCARSDSPISWRTCTEPTATGSLHDGTWNLTSGATDNYWQENYLVIFGFLYLQN